MSGVRLPTVFLGVLLVLNLGTFRGAAARLSRCLSKKQLEDKFERFNRRRAPYLSLLSEPATPPHRRTCEQVARESSPQMRHRALSPWGYRVYHDERLLYSIVQAECLCQGCIINQQEDMSYNSVPVLAPHLVLIKSRCLKDPNKYTVKRELIKIPVACTCVAPSSFYELESRMKMSFRHDDTFYGPLDGTVLYGVAPPLLISCSALVTTGGRHYNIESVLKKYLRSHHHC